MPACPDFIPINGYDYEVLIAHPPAWDGSVDAHVCHRTLRVYVNPSVPYPCLDALLEQAGREAQALIDSLQSAAA